MRNVLLIAVMSAAVPALAQAQSSPSPSQAIDDARQDARMHVGPIYTTPSLFLKELGVDTNVFNQAGDPKSDFTFTLTPKADVWVPVARRALFKGTVASDLVWYAQYSSERSVNPQFSARGEVYLSRITLFAENAYLNTRQRPNYEVDLRSRHLENDASAGVDVRLTPKLSIEGAVVRGITRYDADAFFDGASLQQTLNHDSDGFRTVGRFRITPLTALALRYERQEDRFPYSPLRDSNSYRVMPGVEFKSRALIKGSAFVGYRTFTPTTAGALPEFSGLVSQLNLSYTLLGATTFGVSYNRDLTYSYETLEPFFINNGVGVSVRRALGSRFDVVVSGDRYTYNYRNLILADPLTSSSAPERVDTIWNYGGSFGYRVGHDGRIGFGVSYFDRQSTTRSFRTFNGLRAGSVVTFGL